MAYLIPCSGADAEGAISPLDGEALLISAMIAVCGVDLIRSTNDIKGGHVWRAIDFWTLAGVVEGIKADCETSESR